MADQNPNPSHVHNHRSLRLKVPPRAAAVPSTFVGTPATSRPFSTPTASATPSKHRLSGSSSNSSLSKSKTSLSFLFLILFSLRSLYSLLPFLRSSPSFSLFPFSFLVSLLSFLLTYGFSLCTSLSSSSSSSSSSRDPFHQRQNRRIFSLTSITQSEHRILIARSILLAVVFLLRFQALRYCGAAAMILAELSGNVAARFVADGDRDRYRYGFLNSKARGFVAMVIGLLLLSVSWDRIECFPFSARFFVGELSFSVIPKETCLRIWPMLLPFLSGFLGCYERVSMNRGTTKLLGKKRVRLISLFYTTLALFVPATISIIVSDSDFGNFSFESMVWPLMNTVVFGVLLAENFSEEKLISSKDFRREFLVTFACTLVLELFYFPELSLSGLLICGVFLYIAVRELDPCHNSGDSELGSDSFSASSIIKPIKHILSERKSRKIALFLMINFGYMIVEFMAGFMSNSLGLISDACHMLFDCAALAIGLYASYISRLPASGRFNYGRGRFEVLSGYVNAVFLVLVGSLIVLESLERILDPQEISTSSLLTVSIGGLLVNVIGLIFFHEEHHHAHGGSCSHSHSHDHKHTSVSISHDHDHNSGKSSSLLHEPHGHLGHDHNHHENSEKSCSHHHHHEEPHGHLGHDHGRGSCSHTHIHDHDHSSVSHGNSEDSSSRHHEEPHGHLGHVHGSESCSHTHIHDHNHNHSSGTHENSEDSSSRHHEEPHGHNHKVDHNHSHDHSHDHDHHQRHVDHNMEGIFLHVLADTLGSVGVVISTLLIRYKGWLAADPICSIFISVLIVSSVIPLLRNSAEVLLQRVPRAHRLGLRKAVAEIRKMEGVRGVRSLRVWSFTTTEVVGTLRLCVAGDADRSATKSKASELLREAGVNDLTLQVECVR